MNLLTFDCGTSPLAWSLLHLDKDKLCSGNYREGIIIKQCNIRYMLPDGKISTLSIEERQNIITTTIMDIRDEVKDEHIDKVIIEEQLSPKCKASNSTIPFEVSIALFSIFRSSNYSVVFVSSDLKGKLVFDNVPTPVQKYRSKHYKNKVEACHKLDIILGYIGDTKIIKLPKDKKNHIADCILQAIAWTISSTSSPLLCTYQ